MSEGDFTQGAKIPPIPSQESFTWHVALALALAVSCLASGMAAQGEKNVQDALAPLGKEEALWEQPVKLCGHRM